MSATDWDDEPTFFFGAEGADLESYEGDEGIIIYDPEDPLRWIEIGEEHLYTVGEWA